MSAGQGEQEPVGTLAEEAARFADALSHWAQRHGADGTDGTDGGDGAGGSGEQRAAGGLGERLSDLAAGVGQQLGQQLGQGWSGAGSAAGHGASALAGLTALLAGGTGGSSECRVCPLCQLLAVLRGARPEVYEHLAAALTSVLAAVREAVAASERDWAYRRRGGLQHIDIG